jgi:hypothetical protein
MYYLCIIVILGVNYLCDEVQEYQINIDDENHTVTFLRCNESDIPKAWLNSEVIQY